MHKPPPLSFPSREEWNLFPELCVAILELLALRRGVRASGHAEAEFKFMSGLTQIPCVSAEDGERGRQARGRRGCCPPKMILEGLSDA